MLNFEGKVMLVTGGARGLGEAICRNLAETGATVIAADILVDLLHELKLKCAPRAGISTPWRSMALTMSRKAVFLDKDGTLVENVKRKIIRKMPSN